MCCTRVRALQYQYSALLFVERVAFIVLLSLSGVVARHE